MNRGRQDFLAAKDSLLHLLISALTEIAQGYIIHINKPSVGLLKEALCPEF